MTSHTPQNWTDFCDSPHEAHSDGVCRHRTGLSRVLKGLAASIVLLAGAACSTRSDLGFATLMSEVPATKAIIVPPPGGPAIIAVLQRTFQNGISQEIALATASLTTGQNAFYVSLINDPTALSEIDDVLIIRSPTQETLHAEMGERFPGVEMSTSLIYVQNKYGPFGFATGRSSSGDLCLYAWQVIEPDEPAVFMTHGTISLRLRLCDADATVEQLLRTMYGYTISAFFTSGAWNPYGSPPSPPAHLGQIDAPIYPQGLSTPESVTVARERRVTIKTRPPAPARIIDKDTVLPSAPEPATPSPTLAPSPAEGYPIVPPPPQ